MELTRLKGRLRTAQRGHKLLKDKRDELMKQFMEVVREDLALWQKVEQSLARAYGSFTVARRCRRKCLSRRYCAPSRAFRSKRARRT